MATQALEAVTPAVSEIGVALVGVRKTFGSVVAVDAVDLEIGRGEFFTVLGPSGSAKRQRR